MAHRYVILPDSALAVLTFSGAVDGSEIHDAIRSLYTDPAWRPGYRKLIDALGINELDVSIEDMGRIREMGLEAAAGPGALAIVQRRWLVRLVADLFINLTRLERPFRIFDAMEPALEWLELPPDFDPRAAVATSPGGSAG